MGTPSPLSPRHFYEQSLPPLRRQSVVAQAQQDAAEPAAVDPGPEGGGVEQQDVAA